jgi:hypothetical protein
MSREFSVAIEMDPDGMLVASVPNIRCFHGQAKSLNELRFG